jgi:phosphatidylglycerol:prolipoprotein diacylglycerol transferase
MKNFYWIASVILALALILFVFIPAFAGRLIIPAEIGIGKFSIKLYGIILALSILVGYAVARKFSWKFGINEKEVDDIAFWITIAGLLGARIYYIIFNWQYFSSDLAETYKIWHGGLSIYGSLIAGIVFIVFYSRKKAYSFYQLLDLAAISIPLSQALGRFGNFFNQEAFGLPTNLPWKMYVEEINRPLQYRSESFFHPAFLYEALWNLIVFFILYKVMGRIKPGVLAFLYLGLYSLGRFFIEGIRLDSLYIFGLKADQLVAVLGLLVAGIMITKLSKIPQARDN